MNLKNIVLHQVLKEEGGKPELNCSDHLLPVDAEDIVDFVERFLKIYNKKRPTQGTFKEDADNFPFQKYALAYVEGDSFLEFTKKAMETLKRAIDKPTTKGGYVIFMHYEHNTIEYIVTTMLDSSPQFAVDENQLNIEKLKTLNLDELVRANRVNVNKWQNEEEGYLTFIKGKRAISKFFQAFIGNTDLTSSRINANNLKDGLNEFMRANKYSQDKKMKIFNNIKTYVDRMIDLAKDVELVAVSAIVNPEAPEAFTNYTIENGKQVSGSFRSTLKGDFSFLKQSTVKGNGYKLTFDKELIKKDKITRSGKNIIIKDVSQDILDREFGTE
ncbi:nucleoid-associated protein [Aquimarina latercula]|uniref:nucleoid-associated protein n=1 Tax=Aquimarina latercula TaxID=987 RepID=UPI000480836C|nr:nucleoid-associated protein [Aquimarina latercula]